MSNQHWPRLLASLPAGLTISEVARRLGTEYNQTRLAVHEHKYRYADGRTYSHAARRKFIPEQADWRQSNAEIAREFGVSRERVRVVRGQLKQPFIESRGRKYPQRRDCPLSVLVRNQNWGQDKRRRS